MDRHYKAFISYSWSDKDWGGWLHRTLEMYRTPHALVGKPSTLGPVPARLHPLFKDREEEAAGHGIGAAIEAAMGASEFLIVICSPRSAKSQWVNREVAWFKKHKSKERILALVVDGEPGVTFSRGKPGEECFPQTLLYKVNDDLTPTDEPEDMPLAADVRKEGDGRRGAKLKLAAALLGLGLDDLVKRDDRRRAIRRRWAMGAMAAITAAMSVLAWAALDQRNAAKLAQHDAETQRDEAQSLVEFMLTDLRQRLNEVGRLDILDTVAKRLLESYAKDDLAVLDPDTLGRRARVLLLLGEVENTKGNLDAALARYTEAAATTGEQLRRDPENAQRIFDHSQSVFWVGYVAWQRGDAKTARDYWAQYYNQAQHLVAVDPGNDEWNMELNYSLSNLGTLEMDQGNALAAETHFRRALEISTALLEQKPDEIDRVITTGQAYAWLADALVANLEFDEARNLRNRELALYEKMQSTPPIDYLVLERELAANRSLALINLYLGDLQSAQTHIERAREMARQLLSADPANTLWLEFAGRAATLHGQILIYLGDLTGAKSALGDATGYGDVLLQKDDRNVAWRRGITTKSTVLLARVAMMKGDDADKFQKLRDARDDAKALAERNRNDVGAAGNYAAAMEYAIAAGEQPPERWTDIIELLAPLRARITPEASTCLARAYAASGETAAAQAIAARLFAAGFHHPDFIRLLADYPALADAK